MSAVTFLKLALFINSSIIFTNFITIRSFFWAFNYHCVKFKIAMYSLFSSQISMLFISLLTVFNLTALRFYSWTSLFECILLTFLRGTEFDFVITIFVVSCEYSSNVYRLNTEPSSVFQFAYTMSWKITLSEFNNSKLLQLWDLWSIVLHLMHNEIWKFFT